MSRTIRKQLFSTVDLLKRAGKVLEGELLKKEVNVQAVTELLADRPYLHIPWTRDTG